MAGPTDDTDDLYALDKWLRKFGLWRDASLRPLSVEERKALLDRKDFSHPFVMQRAAFDSKGQQLITLTSYTNYDLETGVFDDKIVYWRHRNWDVETGEGRAQDHYVLQIRAIRDPSQKLSELPRIIPEQIWWNGSQIFDGPVHGGPHNPRRPEYVKLINRMVELSKRVKERLNDSSSPLPEVGKDFYSTALNLDLAKAIIGSSPSLRGLNNKGWNPVDSTVHGYFTRATQLLSGQKLRLPLPPIRAAGESLMPGGASDNSRDISSLERLHVANGYYHNSIEPVRQMMGGREEPTASLDTGISYISGTDYRFDEKSGRHIYTQMIVPEDPLDGSPVPEPFEVSRLEYAQNGDVFTLENCAFMGSPPGAFKTIPEQLKLVGFNVACNEDVIARRYPDYKNHIYENQLQKYINELGIPSKLSETGGDFGWVPMNGCGFDKQVDIFGDGIGGGHLYISRGLKEDGTISEVAILQDLPLAIGGPDSDFDGMNPNIMPHLSAIRNGGAIVLTHDHFDHASLEYLAKQVDEHGNGWLKGVRVICREDVAFIVKKRLAKLEIPKTQWPSFVTYEHPDGTHHPDLIKLPGERQYAYCARDEDGKARIWTQICANGSLHSAETDMHLFTGCYGDEVYHDTFATDGDALGTRSHGEDFMRRGQLALADIEGVTLERLTAGIKDPDKLYIGLDEVTNATSDGMAPTIDQFKNTLRKILKALPENRAVVLHPFSTSHLEIRAVREVCNEPETLRNTTAVGANAEMRDDCINIHGVDPLTDLREIDIPADKLPQAAYDTAMEAMEKFMDGRRKLFAKDENPENDVPLRVFKFIYDQALIEMEDGNSKPKIIFDAFFDGNLHVFDDIAVSIGIPREKNPRFMPDTVQKALKKTQEEYRKKLVLAGKDPDADTDHYMLHKLANEGRVIFKSKGNWNDTFMAQAILRGQKTAARQAGRTSLTAKKFRDDPGNLLVLSTGATGSAAEHMSSLSRGARGDSLFDYETGYKLDNFIRIITQTPSMGEDAQIAQEAVVRDLVNNRGETVFLAFRNGFYIYNPGADRALYMKAFAAEGWNPEWDGANNRIRISGQPLHVHGHRFWGDLRKKFESDYYKAKLIEFVHMPGLPSFLRGRELAERTGHRTSIKNPEDFVFLQCREDENGNPYMHKSAFLTPSYWLFQIKRKYGLQYGGIVKMVLATVARRTGGRVMDALEARSGADGSVADHSPVQLANDWLKARNGAASSRQSSMGPALADVQPAGGKPMGRMASSLIHKLRWANGRYAAPGKEPE